MLLVDDQAGSSTLYPYIKNLVPTTILTRITPPFGDIVWVGNGPDDKPVNVAVEYKQLDDVLKCMLDGRFAGHQVSGLVEHYQRRYLLVEMGRVRIDRSSGILQRLYGERWRDITRGGRGFTGRELEHWITTMEEQAQFRVVRTRDQYESARWVQYKYTWWTSKGWTDHKSLMQFHVPSPPVASFVKPNLTRRWAKDLNDIGWVKSGAAADFFVTPLNMALSNEEDWVKIEGVGKVMAGRIIKSIREGGR